MLGEQSSRKRARSNEDSSVFAATFPVEVTDMILERLDAPSLAAARRTGRLLASVGSRYLRTDDCFSKAMFSASMPQMLRSLILAAQAVPEPEPDFFADEELDALLGSSQPPSHDRVGTSQPFTQLRAGNVLHRYLLTLTPTPTGWVDPSGLVTFTRHGTTVTFKPPGRAPQTGTLQAVGTPGIDTYSAWLQQAVHCHVAANPAARGLWDHVVPDVLPFADAGEKRSRVIQLGPGQEAPFLNTLWRQIHAQNQDLFEDEAQPMTDVLTDADIVTILFQIVSLLADLHGQAIVQRAETVDGQRHHEQERISLQFLSLNNTADIAFVRDVSGLPQARVTNFSEACIELTQYLDAPVRVCQTWSSDRSVLDDLAMLLTELHFIVRNTDIFPRTRQILRTLRVRAMYRVFSGHILASSVRPISESTLRSLLSLLNTEFGRNAASLAIHEP